MSWRWRNGRPEQYGDDRPNLELHVDARLGRQPKDVSRRRITLTRSANNANNTNNANTPLALGTYVPPESVDYYSHLPTNAWGMDGNDQVGDCTIAARDHATKALQAAAGNPVVVSTTRECLTAYSAITGYAPSDPSTDQGAVMQDVFEYQQKHGIVLGGKPNNILLFASVDYTDPDLIKWCVDQFGSVDLGIDFPAFAMDQFNAGKPWDVQIRNASLEGGHAIALVGYDATYYYVVTWGKVQKMTPAFFKKYVEEAWVALDDDFVSTVSGDSPLAETLYELGERFRAVTGKPNPVPVPTPSPPSPPSPVPVDPAPTGFPLDAVAPWLSSPHGYKAASVAAKAIRAWLDSSRG